MTPRLFQLTSWLLTIMAIDRYIAVVRNRGYTALSLNKGVIDFVGTFSIFFFEKFCFVGTFFRFFFVGTFLTDKIVRSKKKFRQNNRTSNKGLSKLIYIPLIERTATTTGHKWRSKKAGQKISGKFQCHSSYSSLIFS